MEREFTKVFESAYRRLDEDAGMPPPDMGGGGGGMPPEMGGGGDGGGGGKPPDPIFATTESIEYLYPFIRIYMMAKERGTLPDTLSRYMIANNARLKEMTSGRAEAKLKDIFERAGIFDGEIDAAKMKNKKKYEEAKKNGKNPSVKKVGPEEMNSMLYALSALADAVRGEAKSGMSDGRAIATDIGFINKEDFDFSSIWTAYNRIMQVLKGEFRGNV